MEEMPGEQDVRVLLRALEERRHKLRKARVIYLKPLPEEEEAVARLIAWAGALLQEKNVAK